jgi:formate hydrogenlyase subunit 4
MEFFLIMTIFTGVLFFSGGDLLLVIFALTLAGVFFAFGGYKASSPYSFIGANREVLQMMAYEPAVLLAAIGLYMVTKSFQTGDIVAYSLRHGVSLVKDLPGIFFAFFYILTIKFRKSPFDLATSHHAHQEIVKGITTEFSGQTLAFIEIAHWYEYVFILGFVFLFFASNIWIGIGVSLFVFFLELVLDNAAARVRWQWMIAGSWIIAAVAGIVNIIYLTVRH